MTNDTTGLCEWVQRFFDGDLEQEKRELFQAHLDGCPSCPGTLEALRGLTVTLRSGLDLDLPEDADLRIRQALHDQAAPGKGFGEVLDIEDVARLLKSTVQEVAAMLETLPSFEFAGRIRFRKQSILQWIQTQEETASQRRMSLSGSARNGLVLIPGGSK